MPLSFSLCVQQCQRSRDCPRTRRNCIDGGCRAYRCFTNGDCANRERCIRGQCSRRRRPIPPSPPRPEPPPIPPLPRPPRRRPPRRPFRPPRILITRVPGSGPSIIPPNLPCPFASAPTDAFSNVKCLRVFCRCVFSAQCQLYRPPWAIGPMQCCNGACVLGAGDSCPRIGACT